MDLTAGAIVLGFTIIGTFAATRKRIGGTWLQHQLCDHPVYDARNGSKPCCLEPEHSGAHFVK